MSSANTAVVSGEDAQDETEILHITRLRALIVEPSSTQQKIISHALESHGIIDIFVADNGADSLQKMEMTVPDLVISAMYLPDMIGTDLIHAMRSRENLAAIAFLLISSETDIRALEPIRQAGAIGILPKPFNQQDLKRALCATIDVRFPEEQSPDMVFMLSGRKILIVDDSHLSRNHIGRVLQNLGVEDLDQAEDGQQALTLLKQKTYDLIVTDYNMPVMDGWELVKYIRSNGPQNGIPIMMITSEQDCERLAAVEAAGISAICDKPFEPRAIGNLVRRLLESSPDS